MAESLVRLREYSFSLLRVVVGALFACHGAQKLFGFPGGHHMSLPPLLLVAGVIEFFGGLAMALGLGARFAAFVASGEMAVAYFTVHFRRGWWPIQNGGELAIVYCFVFLFIVLHGSGVWSVDRLLARRGGRPPAR